MNCCSRSTLGIIIGALNIFVFGVFIIYIIALLTEIDDLPEESKFFFVIIKLLKFKRN